MGVPLSASGMTLRQAKILRWGALKTELSPWTSRWRDITEYLLPFAGRYFVQDRNKPKSFNSIYDSTATRALRILAAGMMAGMTSPARPWFRLAVMDDDLMDRDSVKLWLARVETIMRAIFAKSNTYRSLHSMYEELGAFSTAVNIIEPNFKTVIWNTSLTAGEYAIACDPEGRVNTVYREFEMTVAQIVEEFVWDDMAKSFDWSRVTPVVKTMWDTAKGFDQWRPVLHVIEPRLISERAATSGYMSRLPKNMPWRSCYLELDMADNNEVLRESGFEELPVLGVRWHTRGRDIYGNGPGMEALGDVKQLQHEQLRKGQAIDFMVQPPIGIPGAAKGREIDRMPGGVSHLGAAGSNDRAHNLFDVKLDLGHLLNDINDVRVRINQAFYADLFLMISNDQRRMPVTAREIAERHEEKLLMLGPVLERLHDEMLAPLIETTFMRMVRAGILPPPPSELQGMDLKIEFVSTLAQAQKAVGLASVDRLIGTVALIAQGSQDFSVWDKINKDEVVDKYSDMLAVDPNLLVADDNVAIIRADRAKAQQAAQTAAVAPQMAKAAKDMSQVDTENLQDVTHHVMGYT
jgi:hypothetical protein